ncbi:unnamed protein product [Camellia sinensis]
MVFGSSFLPMTDRELVKTIDLHPQPNHSTCKTVRSSPGGFGLDGLPGLQNGSAAPKSRIPQMVAQTLYIWPKPAAAGDSNCTPQPKKKME